MSALDLDPGDASFADQGQGDRGPAWAIGGGTLFGPPAGSSSMPRTGPIDSEDNASMKSARSNFRPRATIRQGAGHDQIRWSHPPIRRSAPLALRPRKRSSRIKRAPPLRTLAAAFKVLMIGRRSEPSDRN